MSMNVDEARSWLEIFYGDTPGFINICSTLNWAGKTFSPGSIEEALAYICQLDAQGAEGIYARATTLRTMPESGRGGDDLSFYLPGLWADIDIAGPGHKTKQVLPPTVADAMKIISESGLPQPSHWVHSGGGLYPWWLLRTPVEIDDVETFRTLSAGWQKVIEASAVKLGFHYGSGIGDLSRVLRVPGTINRKEGLQRPCGGLEGHSWDGQVFELSELIDALAACTPEPPVAAPLSKVEQRLATSSRPGDDFNNRVSWHDLLLPLGWQWVYKRGDKWHLRRPGKTSGTSATLSNTTDRLFVFSEECHPLDSWKHYSKFELYAAIEHHGNYAAAAKELARLGYGTPVSSHDDARMVLDSVKATQAPVVLEQAGAVSDTAAHAATVLPEKLLSQALERDSAGLPVYPDDIFKNEKWDHSGIADNWVDIHSDTFAYLSGQKTWMMWQGDKWARDERLSHRNSINQFCKRMRDYGERAKAQGHDLGEILAKEGKKLCTSAAQSSILNLAMTNPDVSVSVKDFDTNPNLITLRNGVLDIKTGELMAHDPALRLTRKVNASFDPDAKEGRWTRFMEEVLPDQQVREYVQRICGYMLTGTLNERVMLLIHGESGTGKTQFLEALYAVMGDFAGIAPASAFAPRQNGYKGPSEDLHKLMGKRLVLQSELDSGSRLNESLVKSIVGADMQTTRTLYGEPVDWQPEYTVFLATNYLPRISSSDNAIWNRVKPVKFEQVFINERGQALNPDDRNLGRKMAAEEADVILTWMLEGLKAYMERGLDEPEQIGLWTQGYRDDVDTTRQFISEAPEAGMITLEDTKEIGVRDLYKVYVAWCQDNSVMGLGFKVFNERMASSGWRKEKREKGIMWQGIGRVGMIVESQTSFMPRTWAPQRL